MTIHWTDRYGYLHEVKAGMFGLSRIGGLLGKLISAGQAFAGDGSRWTHAFVVLDDETVIEAMPGGARIVPIGDRLKHDEVVFSDEPIQDWLVDYENSIADKQFQFTDRDAYFEVIERWQRMEVVQQARLLRGVRYGYLQYFLMGLVALGFHWQWLEDRVARKDRMICSQLVDEIMLRSGIHIFDDGRLSQHVTPGDLAIRYGII